MNIAQGWRKRRPVKPTPKEEKNTQMLNYILNLLLPTRKGKL